MLFRGAVALTVLGLALALLVTTGQSRSAEAITAGECLDPARGNPDTNNIERGNSVSIWEWNASNGANGRMTAVQTHFVPPFLDGVSLGNFLGQAWSGIGIGIGNRVFLIETGKGQGGFAFAPLTKGTPNTFTGIAIGGQNLFTVFNVTNRLACYDNRARTPSFEITDENQQTHQHDAPIGWNRQGWGFRQGVIHSLDTPTPNIFSGDRSLVATAGTGDCGEHDPRGNYWESDDLNLSDGEHVVGVFTRSPNSANHEAEFGIVIRVFGIFAEYLEAGTRASQDWGMASGVVDLPAYVGVLGVTEHMVIHADFANCGSASGTATVHFDDAFVIRTAGGPKP